MPKRRRSWLSASLIANVAAVAAAVAVVGIGLQVVNRGGFGTGETPTPSGSDSPSGSGTPLPSVVPSLSLPSPSAAVGAFGPSWRMTPDEAFQPVTTCENLGLATPGFGPGVAYRISMPAEWFHGGGVGDCVLFGPEPFEPTDPPTIPEAAAIWITGESRGIPFPNGSLEEYTVDGLPAVRWEIHAEEAGITESSVVWIIGVPSRLPNDGVDSPPYLAISTSSSDTADFEAFVDVLDRMVATLVVLQPQDG